MNRIEKDHSTVLFQLCWGQYSPVLDRDFKFALLTKIYSQSFASLGDALKIKLEKGLVDDCD
jgi:hypothetical protein